MGKDPALAEGDLLALLARRYAPEAWAFFAHVPSDTSGVDVRIADGLAVGVQPATKHEIHGFEVKVSRSDWLREKGRWTKSGAIARYCDRFYLVIPESKGDAWIVKDGELPPDWGLYVAKRAGTDLRLFEEIKAPKRQPVMLSREFLASLARQSHRAAPDGELVKGRERIAYDNGQKAGREHYRQELERVKGQLNQIEIALGRFEEKSGIKIDKYTPKGRAEEMGAAVRLVLSGGAEHYVRDMERLFERFKGIGQTLDGHMADLRKEGLIK